MQHLLETIEFRDLTRARRELAEVVEQLGGVESTHVEALLAVTPDPDRALSYLNNLKHRHPTVFQRLVASPTRAAQLIAVFSYSHFLADELLQKPLWLEEITGLDRLFTQDDYQ